MTLPDDPHSGLPALGAMPLARRHGPKPKVLVIDDELPIRRLLRASLEAQGLEVEEATSARAGLQHAAQDPPDLIILDLGLPDGDGLEVTRQIRSWSQIPIVILSARGQESDKVAALDAGADDYLTKPFGLAELNARLRVALRHAAMRVSPDAPPVYECTIDGRTLRVDLSSREVLVWDSPSQSRSRIKLTPHEYRLLEILVRYAGRVLTHKQLLEQVWGPEHAHDVQYLRVYAGQLRRKIEKNPALPNFLITEPGVGYRMRSDEP